MTYTVTVSSKGQITLPIAARRKLGLGKKVLLDLRGDELVIKQQPTIQDIWAILGAPTAKKTKPHLSDREQLLSDIFTNKYKNSK